MRTFVLALTVLLSSGCTSFPPKTADVVFKNPYTRIGAVSVEPTEEEKSGVQLQILPPAGGVSRFREEHILYAHIQNGKGIQLEFTMDRTEKFKPGIRPDSFILSTETTVQGQKGRLMEEEEMTSRGEILKFTQGFHHSKIGNFRIVNWSRTPVFPAGPVKIGDPWSYDEMIEVRIESRWVKEIDSRPYQTKATSTLEGFARVKDKRSAVIRTRTRQTKREHFKVFFKKFEFNIHSQIDETTYLDYATGTVLARITKTQSYTEGINLPISDSGQSQSILIQSN